MTAPTVQTVEAEGITDTTVILRGYCWDIGADGITYIIFRYKKVGDEWSYSPHGYWEALVQYFADKVTGLTADSNYLFEICGVEGENWNYGGEVAFKTRAEAPVGTAGHYWVEGNYWCYIDSAGYKRKVLGVG